MRGETIPETTNKKKATYDRRKFKYVKRPGGGSKDATSVTWSADITTTSKEQHG